MANNQSWYTNAAQVVASGGGQSGSMTPTPSNTGQQVWMGEQFRYTPSNPYGQYVPMGASQAQMQARENQAMRPTMWSQDKARFAFSYLDPQMRDMTRGYAASQLGHWKFNQATEESYYNKAIDKSLLASRVLGRPVSPWEIMQMGIDQNGGVPGASSGGGGGGWGGGGGGGGGGPTTTMQVTLTNASDAEMIVDQALTQYLGREADPKERENFWKLLNSREAANPNVTTTTPGVGTVSAQSSGGLNPQEAAKEFALSRKDAAEYMANTQYMDWLTSKIAADPTEGIASGL